MSTLTFPIVYFFLLLLPFFLKFSIYSEGKFKKNPVFSTTTERSTLWGRIISELIHSQYGLLFQRVYLRFTYICSLLHSSLGIAKRAGIIRINSKIGNSIIHMKYGGEYTTKLVVLTWFLFVHR